MINRSFYNAATGIDGVQGYYLHYSEELAGEPDGFWYARKDARHEFTLQPITPVQTYDEADVNRTNWYYRPLRAKKSLWLAPYVNGNNHIRMISYVMPVFVKGQFVAVVMVDLNQLKEVNDGFGHEKGNIAIKSLCQAVCRIYQHSPVYRIGGDEFVVILEGEDYGNRDTLFQQLHAFEIVRDLSGDQPWDQLAASAGMAVYDASRDTSYQSVFNRADAMMYKKKQHLSTRL